jgi:hypothetical protein
MDASHEPNQWYQCYELLYDLRLHPRTRYLYTQVHILLQLFSLLLT